MLSSLTLSLIVLPRPAVAGGLVRLASPGPWPGVSHLIAYDNSVWFVNSEPYENFNAADVYRYDPASGTARYERGLASQDAGTPAVFGGRLYWPYEDPRSSAMLGEYEVSDGNKWQWHSFTEGSALHVHVMAACGGRLLAGTGGWEGALQASSDNGRSWREILRLSGPHKAVTRIVDITEFKGRCLFSGSSTPETGDRVFELLNGEARPLAGWPAAQRITALTPFKGSLYALSESDSGRSLLRYDGTGVSEVTLATQGLPRDLTSNGEMLYAVTSDGGGGEIWQSSNGADWSMRQRIDQERPIEILAVGQDIYVGTYSQSGRGALWGPARPGTAHFGAAPMRLDDLPVTAVDTDARTAALRTLDAALAPKPDYTSYRSGIMGVVLPLALSRDASVGSAFSNRMNLPMPEGQVMTFTQHAYSYSDMARWLLLHAMGLNGQGWVRNNYLRAAWTAPPRPSEKYFDTVLAAIWTAARVKQNNTETLGVLIERLDRKDDPAWLKGDVVATLTALTGKRFGHDLEAWKAWWKSTGNKGSN